ncbi:unnamed protein product [Phytomonas sp. Hart1]|nr:unnamed protein product [Phytomonas sp. Hart1]|eukprot:CCW69729.1 unnamed protein product [Phytomonas sp. isolate Hart1]
MLRRSFSQLFPITGTCVPSNLHSSTDIAFFFPRFQPATHVSAMGIPEIQDALHALHPDQASLSVSVPRLTIPEGQMEICTRWTTAAVRPGMLNDTPQQLAQRLRDREKGLILLERGIDILENLGGLKTPVGSIAQTLRALYAVRFELLNGTEHLPRPEYAKHLHVQKMILRQSARLLYYNENWDRSDLHQLDTACVILAHFIKAFCALHQKPFHKSPQPVSSSNIIGKKAASSEKNPDAVAPKRSKPSVRDWQLCVNDPEHPEAVLTLPMVMKYLDECIILSKETYKKHGDATPNLRWLPPKLYVLKALLNIPLTGNLFFSSQYVDKALQIVDEMTSRPTPLLNALNDCQQEPETGLFMLIKAELNERIFDWDLSPGEVDTVILQEFTQASNFFSTPFESSINADGILSAAHVHERWYETQAYATSLGSYATFLLNAPRPLTTSSRDAAVFLPKQTFDINPLRVVESSSDVIYSDVKDPIKFSIEKCRRLTGEAFDRALKVNRMVFSEYKNNAQAGWILLGMACMYADMRDYLYATGLFESAGKCIEQNYGATSMEMGLMQKLRYEFLAGVGSEEEAKGASHSVIRLLKGLDSLPC